MGKKHKKHHKSEKSEKMTTDDENTIQTPLKLVLKVGGATPAASIPDQPMADSSMTDVSINEGERKHKHKKKKKKKSGEKEKHRHRDHSEEKHEKHEKHKKDRKRTHEAMESGHSNSSFSATPATSDAAHPIIDVVNASPASKRALVMEPEPFETPVARTFRERQVDVGASQLQACLDYIHKQLQRKDVNGFFGFPVTDNIAPGYSSIIHTPMDFSTMKSKIENHDYASVTEFKRDFRIMCDNCAVYNRPETVYYKEAKRLLSIGNKMMSKEKLILMRKNLSFMGSITNEELGIEEDDLPVQQGGGSTETVTHSQPKSKPKPKPKPSKFEAIPDDLTPDEILTAAREAAKDAADELTLRKPKSKAPGILQGPKIGFLRRRPDGSTTLNLLNPDNDGIVSEKERIVNLGQLTGKLTSGLGSLTSFKEDKRNKASPVNYVSYGPFSSFAPSYDSSFANLSKEDTDLLLSTYGDDTGMQYALSLKSFVENAGPGTNAMVDSLLNVLTGNEHSKANQLLEQRKKEAEDLVRLAEEQRAAEEAGRLNGNPIDFQSLHTLSEDLGIDMSFLESFEKQYRPEPKTEEEAHIDAKLQETSALLRDLQKTQNERLSRKPPPHLAHLPTPSDKETKLAEKVTFELTQLAKQAIPSDLTSVAALRQAMGLSAGRAEPITQHEEQEEEVEALQDEVSADNILSQFSPSAAAAATPVTTDGTPGTNTQLAPDPTADIKIEPSEELQKNPQGLANPVIPDAATQVPITESTPTTSSEHVTSTVGPGVDIVAIAAAEVHNDDDGDIEQDLAEFLQTGPLLQAYDSPNIQNTGGGLDPADLM